jgi:hypothetical protein
LDVVSVYFDGSFRGGVVFVKPFSLKNAHQVLLDRYVGYIVIEIDIVGVF